MSLGKQKRKWQKKWWQTSIPYLSTNFLQKRVDEDNVKRIDTRNDIVVEAVDDYAFTGLIIHRDRRRTWDSKCCMQVARLQEDLFLLLSEWIIRMKSLNVSVIDSYLTDEKSKETMRM